MSAGLVVAALLGRVLDEWHTTGWLPGGVGESNPDGPYERAERPQSDERPEINPQQG